MDNIDTFVKSEISLEKNSIMDKWLIQSGNNCRYNSFITIFYFIFTSYIKNNMDNKPNLLNELADLILKLSDGVSYKIYFDIITKKIKLIQIMLILIKLSMKKMNKKN